MTKIVHVLILPIVVLARFVHGHIPQIQPHHTKLTFGVAIMMSGSYMATHHVAIVPLFIWDSLAYGLHGYGSLPIIYVLRKHLADLEIDEKPQHKAHKTTAPNQGLTFDI